MTDEFTSWANTDQRLEILNHRLQAWSVADQLPEIFNEAMRKLSESYEDHVLGLDAPADSVLKAFEETLTDFDNILLHFPQEYGS